MTSNVAYLHASWTAMTAALGEPNANDDRDTWKVAAEWDIQLPDGTSANVYDYWERAPRSHRWYLARPHELAEWHVQGNVNTIAQMVFGPGGYTITPDRISGRHREVRAKEETA